uniref:Uncharacterized protein n=1 Tax=Oryza brachyantha TaxID=4533 RepID=J3LX57_ORYBR
MPGLTKSGFGVVVLDGKLFVMAGYVVEYGKESVSDEVYQYDSSSEQISNLSIITPMPSSTDGCSACLEWRNPPARDLQHLGRKIPAARASTLFSLGVLLHGELLLLLLSREEEPGWVSDADVRSPGLRLQDLNGAPAVRAVLRP